jgi:hypothetical protein
MGKHWIQLVHSPTEGRCASSMCRPHAAAAVGTSFGWFVSIQRSSGSSGRTTSTCRKKSTRMAHSLCFHYNQGLQTNKKNEV